MPFRSFGCKSTKIFLEQGYKKAKIPNLLGEMGFLLFVWNSFLII